MAVNLVSSFKSWHCLPLLLLALLLPSSQPANAGPSALAGWEDWILDQHPDSRCPWLLSKNPEHVCAWPGQLALITQPNGLSFTLDVEVFADQEWVPLPGDANQWPAIVRRNGQAASVVEQNNRPYVPLPRGAHRLEGVFKWSQKPNAITVPDAIALVTLTQEGEVLPVVRSRGRIVFNSTRQGANALKLDSLSVSVFRLLEDDIPLQLTTRIKLSVSGKPREITLGRVVLEGSEVTGIDSPLPARIEPNGDIRLQLTAGEHQISVYSRFLADIGTLAVERVGESWPAIEYLSFSANTALRQTKLSGAVSIDTSQIDIPEDWAEFPTYRLDKDSTLSIETIVRGDRAPLANQLQVKRQLWLDFDGQGMTALENVSGRMYQDWRLNAQSDTQLGRATVAGQPVLITDEAGMQGIEVRSPDINLEAVSRIERSDQFSVSGWRARTDSYKATLHIPPGWRVLHATGVDRITGTWMSQWNLWAIFLVLMIIAATHKLLGLKTAVLAGAALVVAYHEQGAPILAYPWLLLAMALLTVLTGRWRQSMSLTATGICVILAISLVSFAVSAFRLTMYPSLEKTQLGRYQYPGSMQLASGSQRSMQDSPAKAPKEARLNRELDEVVVTAQKKMATIYQVDEKDRVQTGPGLPTWLWSSVHLQASSPVAADETMALIYSPPWLTGLWRIMSVLLLGCYAALLMRRLAQLVVFKPSKKFRPAGDNGSASGDGPKGISVGILILSLSISAVLSWLPGESVAEEFPPQYLFDELRKEVLKPPKCLPNCVSANRGKLKVGAEGIELSFDAYADADIAMPIPQSRDGWQLQKITVDGAAQVAAAGRGQQTLIRLTKGHHQVVLSGILFSDQASIAMPLPIHNFSVDSEGWLVEGVVDGRVPSRTLTLHAKVKTKEARQDHLIADPVAPFVKVERNISLGKQWHVYTTVRRVAPKLGPLAVSVPLLTFEQVLTDGLEIKDGQVHLQFSPNQRQITWQSKVTPVEEILLRAADTRHYVETWSISPSSLWRIRYEGIPAVKGKGDLSTLLPQWKPWPGESLAVKVNRPQGVLGPTNTVEETKLTFTAGARLQKSSLDMEIRSSLGDEYRLELPEGAEVTAIALDGKDLNVPSDNVVTIPLQPGLQKLALTFQQHSELTALSASPSIKLSSGATNISLRYVLPRDRWLLYLSGPAIGPAMIYWGVLCVIVLGAFVLSFLAKRFSLDMPISLLGWLLLGLGLSTINSYGVLVIAVFFFLLAFRQQRINPQHFSRRGFNGLQSIIIFWTVITAVMVIGAIPMGLLSNPNMQVIGNGSYSHLFNFYQDRTAVDEFPRVMVLSVPIMVYRLVMLAWSLWLATQIVRWAQWWWKAFSAQRVWVGDNETDSKKVDQSDTKNA